jgi:hypothetical protein
MICIPRFIKTAAGVKSVKLRDTQALRGPHKSTFIFQIKERRPEMLDSDHCLVRCGNFEEGVE